MKIRKSKSSLSLEITNNIILSILALCMLYPFYFIIIQSLSSGKAILNGQVKFWPVGFNIETYKMIFRKEYIYIAYKNTLIYTGVGVIINVVLSGLCGYALSKKKLFGRNIFMKLILFTMFFEGGLIPLFLVVQKLGMLNTLWAVTLPVAINTYYMIIMRTFFQSIPSSLEESAFLDGANDIQIFIRIYIPISQAIIATMILFYSVYHWNSYFYALIFLSKKSLYPLQITLRSMVVVGDTAAHQAEMSEASDTYILDSMIKYAIIIVATLPILCVYPFVQKYFIKGVMIGSVKG